MSYTNSKKQGDAGLGAAIAHYTSKGWTVCLPLTDSQGYDLIIDRDGTLVRVQVKTSTFKRGNNNYLVDLRTKGGTRKTWREFTLLDARVDEIFVLTGDGSRYLFPREIVAETRMISMGKKMAQYLV